MKRIQKEWEGIEKIIRAQGAGNTQIRETRIAFFAGAGFMFQMLVNSVSPGDEPTDADMKMLDETAAELREFSAWWRKERDRAAH